MVRWNVAASLSGLSLFGVLSMASGCGDALERANAQNSAARERVISGLVDEGYTVIAAPEIHRLAFSSEFYGRVCGAEGGAEGQTPVALSLDDRAATASLDAACAFRLGRASSIRVQLEGEEGPVEVTRALPAARYVRAPSGEIVQVDLNPRVTSSLHVHTPGVSCCCDSAWARDEFVPMAQVFVGTTMQLPYDAIEIEACDPAAPQ